MSKSHSLKGLYSYEAIEQISKTYQPPISQIRKAIRRNMVRKVISCCLKRCGINKSVDSLNLNPTA